MFWLYPLAKQRMNVQFQKWGQCNGFHNDDRMEGENNRVRSRISAPRPRPKGYWNPFCPGA